MSAPPLVAIVDDDASMREALRDLVGSLGYRAAAFATADDYLVASDLGGLACLILDVQMPGMNGLDLQRRLACEKSAPPIIFVTSFGDEQIRRRALRGGALCVLEKPVQDRTIIACLEAALGRAPTH